jgi:mono/diheme cytochrome c family protein
VSTLVVVIAFVALALGVLFVAMSGGSRRGRERGGSSGRRTRRAWIGGFLVSLLVLGVGVPAAVIATVEARDDIPDANVANLTTQEKQGRTLFGERCKLCHALKAANATANVGPNLDQLRPPRALVIDAIENGRSRGNGQMAADIVEGAETEAVAAFVAKATGQTAERGQ